MNRRFSMPTRSVSPFSRRSFLQLSAAAAASQIFTEPMLAAAARPHQPMSKDAVMIDSNENPLGPCQSARDAIANIIPLGGRRINKKKKKLVHTIAHAEAVNP